MIIQLLLLSSSTVNCIEKPTRIYVVTQNQLSLNYELEINNNQYIIDLNNEFSVTEEHGEVKQCDQYYKCQYCHLNCSYTYFDTQDNQSNGTFQKQILKINNYLNQEQLEEFTSLQTTTSRDDSIYMLGLGARRNQNHTNFTYPYNPFISSITSICFAERGFIHRSIQLGSNSIKLKYQQLDNLFTVNFLALQLSENEKQIDIFKYSIAFDSLNPYTKIPSDLFMIIFAYYKQQGFSLTTNSFISIHKKKFSSNNFQSLKFIINSTYYLEYQSQNILYYQGDYIVLPFKKSNQPIMILGISFFNNLYMTIDQNEQALTLSQCDCESEIVVGHSEYYYYGLSIIALLLILVIAIVYRIVKKTQIYSKVSNKGQLENSVELQNQQSIGSKEEDDQI